MLATYKLAAGGPQSAASGTEHSSPSGHASGVLLRCCAREPPAEADPSWLRLEASLRKLLPGDALPSVLVRPGPQERSLPGTPPSSPVMRKKVLRSFRALKERVPTGAEATHSASGS
ncbi:putative huntington associated protein-1 domain [Ixodes scapularis]